MERYLHQKDPNEWTLERLAESFPVDKFGVKKVLKRRLSGSIEEIDKEAIQNWKLLNKGKLELDISLAEHLKHFDRKFVRLDKGDHQKIVANLNRRSEKPKPKLITAKGEFSKIIDDYEKKIEETNPSQEDGRGQLEQIDMGEMQSLFGENTIPGTPYTNESSPYGETSLMATTINLGREKSMDIERFREKYLRKAQKVLSDAKTRTMRPFDMDSQENSDIGKTYFKWVQNEEVRAARVSKSISRLTPTKSLVSSTRRTGPSRSQPENSKHLKATSGMR